MKKLLLLIPVIAILILGISIYRYNKNSISGEEYFQLQDYYVDEMGGITSELDEVTSLYLSDAISAEDYKTHVEVIKDAYDILKKCKEEDKKSFRIKEGSHTYASKRGTEAIDNSFELVGTLIETCSQDDVIADKKNLSYQYIAAQKALQQEMSKYITAKAYYDPEGMILDPTENTETGEEK